MSEIVIYIAKDGHVQLDINLAHDTLWLSQQQIAELFGTQRQTITKHLKNIFLTRELEEKSVCSILEHTKMQELTRESVVANFATTAADGKTYQLVD